MSGKLELQCEAVLLVCLVYVHPTHGSISHYTQEFSPVKTVAQLKEEMAERLGVTAEEQIWIYKGQVLEDSQTLDDVEVDSDDTIEVTRRSA